MAMYKGETKIKDIYIGTEPIVKVYAGEDFCGFFTLSAYNLVSNSDLLIDSNSNNIPDGFGLQGSPTNLNLVNGIWSYETTGGFVGVRYPYNFIAGTQYYIFGKGKTTLSGTYLYVEYANRVAVPVGDTMQFFSKVVTMGTSASYLHPIDTRASSSPTNSASLDYIGAIDITDLVSRGILPSDLTDAQYKTILDNYFNS